METEKHTYSLSEEDFKIWDMKPDFTVNEAACLCFDINPGLSYGNVEIPREIRARINTMVDVLEHAWKSGEIDQITSADREAIIANRQKITSAEFDNSMNRLMALCRNDKTLDWQQIPYRKHHVCLDGPKISRAGLVKYLENTSFRPVAFFPEERGSKQLKSNVIKVDSVFDHSADYRSAKYKGQTYTFTTNQAQIVEYLFKAHEGGMPNVGGDHILEALRGSTASRLKDAFKKHPAWKTLIISGEKKGTYRLDI